MAKTRSKTESGYRHPAAASRAGGVNALVKALSAGVPMAIAGLSPERLLPGRTTKRRSTTRRPPHLPYADQTHERIETACVMSGKCVVQMGDRFYRVAPSDVCVFAPGIRHADTFVDRNTPYSLLWFSIDSRQIGTHLTRYSRSLGFHIIFGAASEAVVSAPRLTKDIVEISKRKRVDRASLIQLKACLLELCSVMLHHVLRMDASAQDDWHRTVADDVAAYLQDRYVRNPSLAEISSHVRLSPNYLCSLFRKQTGETVFSRLNALRMRKAEELLLQSRLSMKEVARESGFASAHYFSRTFRRIHGMSPTAFRAGQS